MSHAASPHDPAERAMSSRMARVVLIVGVVLCVVTAAVYAGLIAVVASDAATARNLLETVHTGLTRTGTTSSSALAVIAGPCIVVFLIGLACVGLAETARRRQGDVAHVENPSALTNESYVLPVHTIGWRWHLVWIVLLAVAYTLLYPVQFAVGLLASAPSGSDVHMVAHVLLIFPALLAASACTAAMVSLIKKLSYPGQLRRHPGAVASAKPSLVTFLYLWRGDLGFAGWGGVFLGISAWPISEGNAGIAVFFIVLGLVLMVAGVLFALQYWRTGRPLGDITVSRLAGTRR